MNVINGWLNKLPELRRLLVMQVYAPGCSMKDVAERMGKSQDGLYQLLRRIRLELKECVEVQASTDGDRGLAR